MLIENNNSLKNALFGKVVLLTGAGGGIGYEAAKAFVYMGARVIIAEIDSTKGLLAEHLLNGSGNPAEFYEIDLADTSQLQKMTKYIKGKYGCPDFIFNNAAITRMGAVDEVDISFWDTSYAVNLRAPLFLARAFLPDMKNRGSGTIVFVSSSGASPYMGAYEVFKTAQVELSNTLAMELENANVYTYTIGPGLVRTDTAVNAIVTVAARMGMSTDAFYEMNSQHIIDAESAGTGFALSVLKAQTYHGQEIGAIQVLMDFHMTETDSRPLKQAQMDEATLRKAQEYMGKILATFEEQYTGWQNMNIFEKQWVLRDLKKSMGLSAEQVQDRLQKLNSSIQSGKPADAAGESAFFENLKKYWEHQLKLLRGYEKDEVKLGRNILIINGWISDIDNLMSTAAYR
ncbi:MAG: SDR family oxidoreductase [Eubacteriales bacterium]